MYLGISAALFGAYFINVSLGGVRRRAATERSVRNAYPYSLSFVLRSRYLEKRDPSKRNWRI